MINRAFVLCAFISLPLGSGCAAHKAYAKSPVVAPADTMPAMRYAGRASPAAKVDPRRSVRILAAVPEIRALLRRSAEELGLPGLGVALVLDGERLWSWGLGSRDLDSGEPVTGDSVFRLGSVTKTFTGLALVLLRDRGILSLDDPVARLVPEIERVIYPTRDSPRLAIRHLVTHSSGLPRVGKLEYTGEVPVSEAQVFDALDGAELLRAPGCQSEYSNLAMAVAGLVVGRAAGVPYREFVKQEILVPLQMVDSYWDVTQIPKPALATGYLIENGHPKAGRHWSLGAAEAMGGLYASLDDLARFVAFQLQAWPPRDASDPGPVKSGQPARNPPGGWVHPAGGPDLGINWASSLKPDLGLVVSHTGGTLLYGAVVWMLPERGLGIVLLTNTGGEGRPVAYALADVAAEIASLALAGDPDPRLVLSGPLDSALDRVFELMTAPSIDGVRTLFSERFLKAVPEEKILGILRESAQRLGKCRSRTPLRSLGAHAAVVLIGCEKSSAQLTLYLEAPDLKQLGGFAIGGFSQAR